MAWLESTPSSLWLSGLAGCGKTMVTTFVITHLQKNETFDGRVLLPDAAFLTEERSKWTKARWAYFYCDANTYETLSTESGLGSILAQLCASEIPPVVEREYRKAREKAGVPAPATIEELYDMLTDTIRSESDVVIVIDGVDEAAEPESLCQLLCSLTTLYGSKLRLFLSSRPNESIKTSLKDPPRLIVSTQVLTHDTQIYVGQRLSSDPRLIKLSDKIRSQILNKFISKPDGM
jgi:Cdc6-like AAA superfamily ATPase